MIQETSQAAFLEVLPTLSDRHQKVLKVLSTVPDATNNEIKEMLRWEINCVTPRVNELVNRENPLVEFSQKRACNVSGKKAMAWRVARKQIAPQNRHCSRCPKDAVEYIGNEPRCPQHLPKVQVKQIALL